MVIRLARVLACGIVLLACSPSSSEKTPKPGCTVSADDAHALVFYNYGSAWAEDVREITAYPDGRVDLRRYDTTAHQVITATAHVDAARLQRLQEDIEATGVFAESEGCYVPEKPLIDASGATLVVQHDGAQRGYSDAGDAPDALERALEVTDKFFSEMASVAR
jgi:hypothetical protein